MCFPRSTREPPFFISQFTIQRRKIMNAVFEMIERMKVDEKSKELISAAIDKDIVKITKILQTGFNVNAKGDGGWTALRIAAWHGDYAMAEFLINHGAAVDDRNLTGQTALMMAASYGHLHLVQLLLDRGADPNARNLNNSTALIIASFHGHTEIVRELLNSGADAAVQSKQGKTALALAQDMRHEEIIDLLITADLENRHGTSGSLPTGVQSSFAT